ncbi:SDR family oxidoreductase [Aquabacterium sp.]|uniref:SDR family oxidoreductase n=1 Tax=Aquabacterium sp. TaxID=1872578 RepID=UPI002CEC4BD2|nr:SDR family oxidoreductase [Aquabacterium sp.]HSW08212.1 SDR family oxidoreductase [Aquabacterium sp.]
MSTPSSRPLVLVTGAARRIGREIALELATHGWDVALHCRHSRDDAQATAAQVQAAGGQAEVFEADLADTAACEALVPAVLLRCGRLDAVVNSASLFEYDDVGSFTVGMMERHWRANTAPAIVLARALHEHLVERQAQGDVQGCVVNLLDQKLVNPNPDYLSYTLSKAALDAATTMLAQALAPILRVCGVAPGVTLPSGTMTSDEFARAHQLTPLQRSSTAADIARTVRFLLESPAITGTTVLVDGGQHLLPQARDVQFLAKGA